MSKIQTLDEILAQMGKPVCAKTSVFDKTAKQTDTNNTKPPAHQADKPKKPFIKKSKNSKANNNQTDTENLDKPTYQNKYRTIKPKKRKKHQLPEITPTVKEDIPMDDAMSKLLQDVAIEPLTLPDKEESRLRWLAFYYLSRRELSQKELRTKLLNKDQDPDKVEALLTEFAEKGYQSDERCAYMLIREAIRRGRGKRHIMDSFYEHGISLPHSLDELIERADTDSLKDGTVLDSDTASDSNSADDSIDWLKLAIEARSKKYGDALPTDPKDKARQLRFLQYRGFEMDVCFDALKMTLQDLDER